MGSKTTGTWLAEVAAPYYTYLDARCDITFASPKGGAIPVDPESLAPENHTASTRRFEADAAAKHLLNRSKRLTEIRAENYDAAFFPGGHGTLVDFPADDTMRRMVEYFYAAGKPLASICHGPACLVQAKKPDGSALVAGHRFTCFSNAEETAVGQATQVPFLLETELSKQGGIARHTAPFTSNVVLDGALMTGQNPASAIPLAEAVIHYLRRHAPQKNAA